METLKINKQNALEALNLLSKLFEGKSFKDPMEHTTYEDVCLDGNIDPVKALPYPNPVTKKQVSANGLFKLETVYDAFNHRNEFACDEQEAWEADYSNGSQRKYYSWHEWNASVGAFVFWDTTCADTRTTLGSRLCTDTEEKERYIAKICNAEWNEFLNPQI